jgi:hypothetical protein
MVTIFFLIVPAFVLLAIGMVAAIFARSDSQTLRSVRPYLASVLLWSTMGFLVANALLVALWFVPGVLSETPGGGSDGRLILLLVVGPLAASAGGLIGGAVFAVRRVDKNRRMAEQKARMSEPPSMLFPPT